MNKYVAGLVACISAVIVMIVMMFHVNDAEFSLAKTMYMEIAGCASILAIMMMRKIYQEKSSFS